jgi:FeS assembly SUF system regulator
MIRLTKFADYGLLLLAEAARHPAGARVSAKELAAAARVPLPMTTKILKALAKRQLLVSHRGTTGGYALARPADEITVAEVVEALDGPIALTECASHHDAVRCSLEGTCCTSAPWQRVNRAVVDALSRLTLRDMAESPPAAVAPH